MFGKIHLITNYKLDKTIFLVTKNSNHELPSLHRRRHVISWRTSWFWWCPACSCRWNNVSFPFPFPFFPNAQRRSVDCYSRQRSPPSASNRSPSQEIMEVERGASLSYHRAGGAWIAFQVSVYVVTRIINLVDIIPLLKSSTRFTNYHSVPKKDGRL